MSYYKSIFTFMTISTLCLTSVAATADSDESQTIAAKESLATLFKLGKPIVIALIQKHEHPTSTYNTPDDPNPSSQSASQSSSGTTAHANLTWQGPGTCLACHTDKAKEVHASAHYQWQGAAPYMVNAELGTQSNQTMT